MIRGTVNARLEATIPLQVSGPQGQTRLVVAVIDTGYNGAFTLPMSVVTALALPPLPPSVVRLGDASQKVLNFYSAEVLWDGQSRHVRVLSVERDPLAGTALLKGYNLNVNFVDGRDVIIEACP
jgi:clan AA aspartic protease